MQRYHRNRHRLIWLILLPLLLAALAVAILNRPLWPAMESLPAPESEPPAGGAN